MSLETTEVGGVRLPTYSLDSERSFALALVLPTIVTVLAVTIIPMLWSLWLAFHRWNPGGFANNEPQWNGIGNFQWLVEQPRFWDALINFAYYGLGGVILQVTLGTALGLALYNHIDSRKIQVAVLILFTAPMMYAPIVAGNMWLLMFTQQGVVNGILQAFGLPAVSWLGSKWLGLTSLIIADTWQWTGLPMIIVYGGRVGLPDSWYEAAELNGASRWMTFRHITLPQLRNLIAVALLLRFMDLYKFFDKMFIMTNGGPGTVTEFPTFFAYQIGFNQFQIGRAASMTWVLGLGATLIMLAFWRLVKQTEVV